MIIEYYRPTTIQQVLELLKRESPRTYPMGGGTKLNQPSQEEFAVVDLQALVNDPDTGLGQIVHKGNSIVIGAGVNLEQLMEYPGMPKALQQTIRAEATYNLRHVATAAGTIVVATGRSAFVAALLAMDAQLTLVKSGLDPYSQALGEFLLLRETGKSGILILSLSVPVKTRLAYQSISRTPEDLPVVASAVSQWPSGRTRVVLAGYGSSPWVVFDGPEALGAPFAAHDAYQLASDPWAGAAYRSAMAEILVQRCLDDLALGE
jgi:CO/xanthine dehydrogenase FAD-binding subunit